MKRGNNRARASALTEDDVVISTPVHTALRLAPDGGDPARHSVLCPRRGATVDLSSCRECGHARSIPEDPHRADAYVECAPGLPSVRLYDTRDRANATPIGACMRPQTVFLVGDSSLDTIERCLVEKDLGAVVVVDEDERPVGIITKSDLLLRGTDVGTSDDVKPPEGERALHVDARLELTALDVMTPIVHALPDDAPLAYGIALLATAQVEQVPIVGAAGEVLGLFSTTDAVRWLARELGYQLPPA